MRAALSRRREVSSVGMLRLVGSHPRGAWGGSVVEVDTGGASMVLTTKMIQQYRPIVQAADAGSRRPVRR